MKRDLAELPRIARMVSAAARSTQPASSSAVATRETSSTIELDRRPDTSAARSSGKPDSRRANPRTSDPQRPDRPSASRA